MAHTADTTYRNIGVGTSLHIMQSPTVSGTPPQPLLPNTNLPINHSGGGVTNAKVISSAHGEATIELADGSKWRMTHHRPDDPPSLFAPTVLHSQDWVIREEA